MWRGLYTAATGMITESKRTDVIANNIANAATNGYKRDLTVHREFENMLIKRVYDGADGGSTGMTTGANLGSFSKLGTSSDDVTKVKGFSVQNSGSGGDEGIGHLGLGDYIAEIAVDHEQGPLESTGNTFDLAISGNGFFALQTPEGVRYTRNGAFFRNQDGVLQDIRGYNLLDTTGNPITIPPNVGNDRVVVTPNGTIFAANQQNQRQRQLAQIQFVQFNNRRAVQKQGDNLFYAVTDNNGNVAQPQQATGQIMQGMLEKSNTQIVSEMVELIHNQRMYEANSKAVITQDTMLDASVNQVGRLS